MLDSVKSLEGALAEEIRLERELLAAGTRKRDALVALDMKAVEQATAREQHLIAALGPAAERRLRRTSEATRQLGLADGEATVSHVAHRSGEPSRTRLLALVADLKTALREVTRVNGANKALTEQSLAHVKHFFRLLGGGGEELTYTRRGVGGHPETARVMIDEVA